MLAMCVCNIQGCQKRASDPPGSRIIDYSGAPMWMLGIEPVCFGREASALYNWYIFPAQSLYFNTHGT